MTASSWMASNCHKECRHSCLDCIPPAFFKHACAIVGGLFALRPPDIPAECVSSLSVHWNNDETRNLPALLLQRSWANLGLETHRCMLSVFRSAATAGLGRGDKHSAMQATRLKSMRRLNAPGLGKRTNERTGNRLCRGIEQQNRDQVSQP